MPRRRDKLSFLPSEPGLKVPAENEFFMMSSLIERIQGRPVFGIAHERCRIVLSSKANYYRAKYGEICHDEKKIPDFTGKLIRLHVSTCA